MQESGAVEPCLQPRHHLVDLRHVRAPGDRPGDYLVVEQVHHRGEVGLAPGLAELGDVGDELPHGLIGGELPVQDVAGDLSLLASIRAVPLSSDLAGKPLLAHEPEHGLPGHAEAVLVAQRQRDLSVAHSVRRS